MPTLRTGVIATATALLATTATVAATQSSVSAAPPAPTGLAILRASVDLPPGAWTDTPLEVNLPKAGTYELDADVRGRLAGVQPLNTYISARLWNVTSATEVPLSERLIYQVIGLNPGTAQTGGNQTAPISELVTVTGPTTIRLQAQNTNAVGAARIAQIASDIYGYTSLRYVQVHRPPLTLAETGE